ncbi:hypothetical protein HDK64DRAFT_340683 [Phyllosticta capitalensis]
MTNTLSDPQEQIELQELEQGSDSGATSEVSTTTSSVVSKFREEFEDSDQESEDSGGHDNDTESDVSSNTSEATESSTNPEDTSEASSRQGESSGTSGSETSSDSTNSSDESSDEGEAIVPVPIRINKGKKPASELRSILKRDSGKKNAVVPVSENNKDKTRRCTCCNRPVSKVLTRRLPCNINSTAEEATDKNTIYNLEGYYTSNPITIVCDRCSAVGKALDCYKAVTVVGKEFKTGTDSSRKMRKKVRTAVLEREKALARSEKRKSARESSKSATVAFAEGTSDNEAGVRSDAASAASVASTVSFAPFPDPVDGVGAIRRHQSFHRYKRTYKAGRWSWEATWERGDLEEYDYRQDHDDSTTENNSSTASTIAESSAMGAARETAAQEPEEREDSQGWLDTSGVRLPYKEFYEGVKKKPTRNNTTQPRYYDAETRTIRRKKEPTFWGYLKELGKFWCCL